MKRSIFPVISLVVSITALFCNIHLYNMQKELIKEREVVSYGASFNISAPSPTRCYDLDYKEVECKFKGEDLDGE